MIEDLLQQLIERLDNRYYGKHRGYVSNVTDPDNQGRIKAYVPRLLGEAETGWAMPCSPYAGPDQGVYMIPDVGAGVWIEFEGGDLSRPIWSGMWWGKPTADDVGQADSTARFAPDTSEIPKESYPDRIVDPAVRMIKSATGHYILLDDRPDTARIEIRDSLGSRIILDKDGITMLAHNHTMINEGNLVTEIDGEHKVRVSGAHAHDFHGGTSTTVEGDVSMAATGGYSESYDLAGYTKTIDHNGLNETLTGPRNEQIRGSYTRRVAGAVDDTAMGGFGLTSGGNLQIAAGKAFKVAAVMPDMPGPSLNAISLDALIGNVSINTMLGMGQFGGLTAISPMVLGDGLAIHFVMLAQILKTVNPLAAIAYGPLLDAWAAMTPLLDWSYFGFVKRFPFGP